MGGRLRKPQIAAPPPPAAALTSVEKRPKAAPGPQPGVIESAGHANAVPPALSPQIFGQIANALQHSWQVVARPEQLAPPGDWRVWLLLAGRGFGKTRSGAEWVRSLVESGAAKRVAIVCPTAADCRDVATEGASGLLAISPDYCRPTYLPSKRRIEWPNGSIATLYSADEPERLRGPQHDAAWCDELAAWRYPEAWDQLQFGLRLGTNPRCVITTTPKPVRIIRELVARERKDVVITRGTTEENRANLAPAFLDQIVARYAGTRLGRQELQAELLEDVPGALWSHEVIDRARVSKAPELQRIVVAIDPAGSSNENSDETGIVVVGMDGNGHAYVLDDLSGRYPPAEWARKAITAYHRHSADRIVAEKNFGGEMVEGTIRAVDPNVALKSISSARGKVLRAEPVAAFYEQGRVHHAAVFAELEDQMCGFASDFNRATAGYSPDRVDALVFAVADLLVEGNDALAWLVHMEEFSRPNRIKPGQAPPAPPREESKGDTITMKGAPHARHYLGKRLYTADEAGLIQNVDPDHVAALEKGGWQIVQLEQEKFI